MESSGRLASPTWGATLLALVATGNLLLWLRLHPSDQPWGRYVGEKLGAEAMLLLACSLILATLLPPIERAFAGLDRVAQWHRHTADRTWQDPPVLQSAAT